MYTADNDRINIMRDFRYPPRKDLSAFERNKRNFVAEFRCSQRVGGCSTSVTWWNLVDHSTEQRPTSLEGHLLTHEYFHPHSSV